jgi:hypothetical protein
MHVRVDIDSSSNSGEDDLIGNDRDQVLDPIEKKHEEILKSH